MRTSPALLAALALSATGAPAIAVTPALIDPAALAGTWSLSSGGKTCHLSLSLALVEGTKAHSIDLGDCVEAGFPRLRSWSAESDGLAFELDGGKVLFMSREAADRFEGKGRDGREYVLSRNSR